MNDNTKVVTSFNFFGKQVEVVEAVNKQVDFQNDVVIPNFLGTGFNVTETIFNTWILMVILFIFAFTVRLTIRKFKEIPTGFQNAIEGIVELFHNFVKSSMGAHNIGFAPFYFGVFTFILVCNLSGLFAMRPPTADYATTFALGITTFFMIQGFGIAKKGIKEYLKSFLDPFFLFLPINIISAFATPISLSFRLFGNILGGTIIMALYYSMPWIFVKFGIPAAMHLYFDLFAGALQAFIFTMLSMTFVADAIPVPAQVEEAK